MRRKSTMLIVEDDPSLLRGLTDAFGESGYELRVACDGDGALAMAQEERPDVVLLDIMLPGFNGFEVCQWLRESYPDLPILIVSARGAEADIVRGLELGADDYVTKPFGIAELRARVSAALRRTSTGKIERHRFGAFEFDTESHTLTNRNGVIPLTRQESAVLAFFVSNAGRVITRDLLLQSAWQRPPLGRTRTVDRCIGKLRSKLETDPQVPRFLKTVRGIGYRFEMPEVQR